jgi:hypothetical protein
MPWTGIVASVVNRSENGIDGWRAAKVQARSFWPRPEFTSLFKLWPPVLGDLVTDRPALRKYSLWPLARIHALGDAETRSF